MASESYVKLCHRIYEDIAQRLERPDDVTAKFAPKGLVEEVLNREVLRQIFRCLLGSAQPNQAHVNITENEFVERTEHRNLHSFLAVLIFASCSIDATWTFVNRHVLPDDGYKAGTTRLPLDKKALADLFEDKVTVDKFATAQVYFCTVAILRGNDVKIKLPMVQRLPYIEEPLEIGSGAAGKVYRVRIAKRHIFNPITSEENTEPEAVACKKFVFDDGYASQQRKELEVLDTILKSTTGQCKNILQSLGTVEIGDKDVSIFMPLAICDLQKYMTEIHAGVPSTLMAKAELLRCVGGLANGLNFLHTQLKTADGSRLTCYHMDLKPMNILVFQDPERGEDHKIWKLSDFGMSRIKVVRQDNQRESNFYGWFSRPRPPREQSASATVNRRGEGTYLAPESVSSKPKMNASSDVWSLGCIISVLFAYMEAGANGVRSYREGREDHHRADYSDRFFLSDRRFALATIHPVVPQWHKKLVKEAEERSIQESDIIARLLHYIESSVLKIDQKDRASAGDVQSKLTLAYREYSELKTSHIQEIPQKRNQGSRLWRSLHGRLQLGSQPKNATVKADIQKWQVPLTSEAFKGCGISPSGTLVAFWTDIKIVLFTSQCLSSTGTEAEFGPEYSLGAGKGFWNSVDLTEKFLVASTATTESNFQCYIFDLQRGMSVDPNLDHVTKVQLPYREIHRLAISPDSQKVAFLLRHSQDEENPRCLLITTIPDLKERAERVLETKHHSLPPLITLGWGAENAIRFMFAGPDTICVVMRLDLSAETSDHKIPIIFVSLSDSVIFTLDVKSRGSGGSSNAVSFLTSLAPFHGEKACVIVTREKLIQVQTLSNSDPTRDVLMDIANYRILRLMMCRHNDKLLALGTSSVSRRLLLLKMNVPRHGQDLSIEEVVQMPDLLYGEDVTERLVETGDETLVLITTLAGGSGTRNSIIKVSLSPTSF
ncbi:hypothetical protein B0I35DRAFT_151995 [Stachybotrys elegans]|uniref:Protein kinase domain-containing protein n=1 Tax=Stachybotrys elegans TaxID=80388 RepID=A0A8K0SF73_9HYPO|nr:hypothetical protein B0I35DRAFT_151995 [Stachybotrys elegans]